MNLKQALYVKTIAEEGSVTAAAKKLYVSQPSISQMLRLIEEELGVALFERSPFRPTYAGERYLHAAAVMLNTNEILANELQEIRQEGSGHLRLGISRQRAAQILPGVAIGLEAVREGPFISLKAGHNIRVIQDLLFREHGLRPAIYLETDNMETALQVTCRSACYMLCPNIYTDPGSCFYPLSGHENLRHFYACLRQGQSVPKFMRDFLALVGECVAISAARQ